MAKKTYKEKLFDSKDMPKIVVVKKAMLGAKVGEKMLIAPPLEYDKIMKSIPEGEVISNIQIRKQLANKYKADITCPLTAGIFMNIVAQAAEEMSIAGDKDTTPWWRTVKSKGELNAKFPGGLEEYARRLRAEGHEIEKRGKKMFVVLKNA